MNMAIGIYGFRKSGIDKVVAVNTDNIGWLEKSVLQYCQRNFAMDLIFDRIELVKYKPEILTLLQIEVTALADGKVCIEDVQECLFRGKYDYAYIINLDTQNLEFWIGRSNVPPQENRYTPQEGYGGSSFRPYLIAEYPIKDIVKGGPSGIGHFIVQINAAETAWYRKQAQDAKERHKQ